jgi:RNA:NAD 2'-phosphotransferase (TPT1/KptA family)
VNRRWIKIGTVEWVKRANALMLEHGFVNGTARYEKRHQARWRAQKLIDLMVDLGMHERWQLREHTSRGRGGWVWTVEYIGRGGNGNGR